MSRNDERPRRASGTSDHDQARTTNVVAKSDRGVDRGADHAGGADQADRGADEQHDPFDPASLRIDPNGEAGSGVKKVLVHVGVRKPHRQEFFRTHPDREFRETLAILDLKEERETYLVCSYLAAELGSVTK
jgi:hypothetical protein